jgi:hypothetical protein
MGLVNDLATLLNFNREGETRHLASNFHIHLSKLLTIQYICVGNVKKTNHLTTKFNCSFFEGIVKKTVDELVKDQHQMIVR